MSDKLAKCKSIRSFELYLNKGPKSLTALNCWMEGVRDSPSINNLSISCLDTGQWCPALGLLLCGAVWCTSLMALSVINVLMNEVFCLTGVPQVQVLLLHNSFPMWWVV